MKNMITEDKKPGGQEGMLFNKSCHPEQARAEDESVQRYTFNESAVDSGPVHLTNQIDRFRIKPGMTNNNDKDLVPYCLSALGPKKAAFTLAEVLITLGIIGVVAAMTIPTLISNYQKRAWTAQLQKSYAMLNQGFRRMLADDNASLLSQTETFNSIGGEEQEGSNGVKYKLCSTTDVLTGENCENFYKNLSKYFKILEIKDLSEEDNYIQYYLNGNRISPYTGTVITFFNGLMMTNMYFYSKDKNDNTDNTMQGRVGDFLLDINGTKGPNMNGRDIFHFNLGDNGILYPKSSQAFAEYEKNDTWYWKISTNNLRTCEIKSKQSFGFGCAARVLEEGKMNY